MENKSASQHPIYSHYRRVTERLLKTVLSMKAEEIVDDCIRTNQSSERMFCSLFSYLEAIEDYERCIELQRIFEAFKQILNYGK